MWGSRIRDRKRRRLGDHSFGSVKESIRKTSQSLRTNTPKKIAKLKKEIAALEKGLGTMAGRGRIREFRCVQDLIKTKKKELVYLMEGKHINEFVELVKPLLENGDSKNHVMKQQKHTVFLNLFHKEKAIPCFIDRDLCTECGTELITLSQESMNICPNTDCGASEHLIYCTSDFIQNTETKNSQYERGPLYRKYLSQFHEHTLDPPKEVINVVYKHLSRVHMMLSTRVKPTPIAQILRQENLQKWAPMAFRIAKMINQEPIVKLSTEMIDRLVAKFDKINSVFNQTKCKTRKKTMNFEYVTKQMLSMVLCFFLFFFPHFIIFFCRKIEES